MGGHYFGQPYTLPHLLIYQTVANPLSLMWYVIAFSFLQICSSFLHPGWGPLMYMHALLGKSHELQTYRSILSFCYHPLIHPICSILLSPHVHSLSYLYHYLLHLIYSLPWVDDSSRLSAKRAVISLYSFHNLTLIQRFWFERLSHGIRFIYSSVI